MKVLLTSDQVRERVNELAAEIDMSYPIGRELHLVSVLRGGFMFLADLARTLEGPLTIDFVTVASYGRDTRSSGVVELSADIRSDLTDRDVLIVEDIVDTGRTLSFLLDTFREQHPRSLRTVSLLEKPSRRVADISIDYVGFRIEDQFVVGYGLDYAERFRHLSYVAVLDQDTEVERP